MTRLLSFEVEGLAGRSKSVGYELDSDLNIFFGENGSGKTSLLKLLYSAARNEVDLIRRVKFDSARVTFYSEGEDRAITRTITRADLRSPATTTEFGTVASYVDERGRLIRMAEDRPRWRSQPDVARAHTISYLSITRLMGDMSAIRHRYYDTGDIASSELAVDEMFADQLTQTWRQYSNQVLSEVREVQEKGLVDILRSLFDSGPSQRSSSALDASLAYEKASAFLARQDAKLPGSASSFAKKYQEDKRLRSVVDDIDGIEKRIEQAERPRRELQALIDQFVAKDKHIVFGDRQISVSVGDDDIPLTALSSGEKQLVRVLLETANADSSTIIIDEPELSMHIDWQRELVGAMRTINPRAQIILATHSPEIMAKVDARHIFRL